jgi:hypothetical protein
VVRAKVKKSCPQNCPKPFFVGQAEECEFERCFAEPIPHRGKCPCPCHDGADDGNEAKEKA